MRFFAASKNTVEIQYFLAPYAVQPLLPRLPPCYYRPSCGRDAAAANVFLSHGHSVDAQRTEFEKLAPACGISRAWLLSRVREGGRECDVV